MFQLCNLSRVKMTLNGTEPTSRKCVIAVECNFKTADSVVKPQRKFQHFNVTKHVVDIDIVANTILGSLNKFQNTAKVPQNRSPRENSPIIRDLMKTYFYLYIIFAKKRILFHAIINEYVIK